MTLSQSLGFNSQVYIGVRSDQVYTSQIQSDQVCTDDIQNDHVYISEVS